ncbi:hypothetical protein MXB_5290 [Myxobolus squamalis]|nr:hypothetical protein MXB_5290 [Myxobolus squamalis]
MQTLYIDRISRLTLPIFLQMYGYLCFSNIICSWPKKLTQHIFDKLNQLKHFGLTYHQEGRKLSDEGVLRQYNSVLNFSLSVRVSVGLFL